MQIKVRLYALLRAREGADQITLEIPEGGSVDALLARFFETRAAVSALRAHLRIGLNGALIERGVDLTQRALVAGDEIALLPPASGGAAPRRSVKIAAAPLAADAVAQLMEEIARDEDGAAVVFVGRTRSTPGRPAPGEALTAEQFAHERVLSLEYEAAEPYATAELIAICDRLISEGLGGEGGIGVLHAIGLVPLGEISMVTVVASPHRDRAYAVSRALIESIKRDVPIWKVERFASGRVWVANRDALRRSS